MDWWTQWGKERVDQIEKVALTYIRHHVSNRQLAGSWSIVQRTQPGTI